MSDFSPAVEQPILPPGFRLQVHRNEKGCLWTEWVGFTAPLLNVSSLAYSEKLACELKALMAMTYGFGLGDVIVQSNYRPDSSLWVMVKTRRPPPDLSLTGETQRALLPPNEPFHLPSKHPPSRRGGRSPGWALTQGKPPTVTPSPLDPSLIDV